MEEFPIVDLHMHTVVSDGTDTPQEIIGRVKDAGIELFSVTDHDAIRGCEVIVQSLQPGDPGFITGAEFSCRDEEGKYHILGYGYDPSAEAVRSIIDKGHGLRMRKVVMRFEFLKNEFGFTFNDEDIEKLMALDNPGKPHIANLMVQYGYASTKEEAFSEYLNKQHFEDEYVAPDEAIRCILDSGGIPVLAHPSYGDGDQIITGNAMDLRIQRLISFGLKGLEAYYSGFTDKLCNELTAFAERYGLYVTAGSDYHGKNKLVSLADINYPSGAEIAEGFKRFISTVYEAGRVYLK